jgi:hypothetical protein
LLQVRELHLRNLKNATAGVNPANATIAETTLREVQEAARSIGLQIHALNMGYAAGLIESAAAYALGALLLRQLRILRYIRQVAANREKYGFATQHRHGQKPPHACRLRA